ncbi:MAG: hypothetical protein A2X81_19030 [Desulfobacterales bacterium GWB2_56_26]|nr:MAG: hypothetical protein A2X81_19030 [Desulfobacterales bacterium GWB2_56_26]
MKIIFSAAILALCLISAETAIGIATPPTRNHPVPVLIYSHKDSDTVVLRGTVKPFAETTALFTDTAIYPLIGGDFDMIVGKEVNIIGEMVLEDDVRKIEVARVQFDRKAL